MDHRVYHSLFNEIMNRYDAMFVSVIRSHFTNIEDQKDVYQEFSIHLFMLIESKYSKSIDLLQLQDKYGTNFIIEELEVTTK